MAYAVTSGEVVLKGSEMMGMVMGGRAVRGFARDSASDSCQDGMRYVHKKDPPVVDDDDDYYKRDGHYGA
ncbi:hypothetical protein IFR04_000944 [Cadophora malorum]|uniref:Uncharacterized protein n=1 Tax=Cadophora malorum TaxID=108018 RepID=A0A8H7WJE6_9HELO|nr:hypothetical protein IFR04_000944 [Cadophora malorum]